MRKHALWLQVDCSAISFQIFDSCSGFAMRRRGTTLIATRRPFSAPGQIVFAR